MASAESAGVAGGAGEGAQAGNIRPARANDAAGGDDNGNASPQRSTNGAELKWRSLPPMKEARYGAGAGVVNGKLLVAGGSDQRSGNALRSVEEYDPMTRAWRSLPPMKHKHACCTAAVLNGRLIVVGGSGEAHHRSGVTVEEYDASAAGTNGQGKWRQL